MLNEKKTKEIFEFWDKEKKGFLNKLEFKYAYYSMIGVKNKNKFINDKIFFKEFNELISLDYKYKDYEQLKSIWFPKGFSNEDIILLKNELKLNKISDEYLDEIYNFI